jgi:molybdate transport system ATP-binding protein
MLKLLDISAGILKNVNLTIPEGCFAVSGPSGSGKTTLLNIIAGNRPYTGEILYNGENIDQLAPWKRNFRYLNQRLYLFPFLTIEGNLALAQYAAGKKQDREERRKLLADFEIAHLASRKTGFVSGGEQQRAALARALIGNPRLLLLDEPFANLDQELKFRLWNKIKEIKKSIPVILVSHDEEEINALGDICVYIRDGVIQDREKKR